MNKQIQLKASKTNESCLLFNKSNDYSILGFISIVAIFCIILICISGEFKCIPYCIATVIFCFILIYIMHKYKQNKINKFIKNNKSNFAYRIDGKIYELQQVTKKEFLQLKSKEYDFIVLTNQFSVNGNGVAYVIRDKSTLSDPDAGVTYVIRDKRILSDPNAKIYIDKSYSEEISIFYDQITEIKTGKILTAAELKQFLKTEERN